jgi:septal ring factor EnvC (AmiA/AmiB activator)
MRFVFLALLAFMTFWGSLSTSAQTTQATSSSVQEIEDKKKAAKAREKALRAELKKIRSQVEAKRQKMIDVAKKIKRNEKDLIELETDIDEKHQEQRIIETRLNKDKASISNLVLALERMRRVPPEAMIARPGAPLKTAQSAMLLQSTLPRIYSHAEQLKEDLQSLDVIMTTLKEKRASVVETSKKLQTDHQELAQLLKSREGLYDKTSKDVKRRQAELRKISKQARSLRDLVAKVERKQREEDRLSNEASAQKASFRATPVPKSGEAQLPISGLIKVGYGQTDEIGAQSKGVRIQGRENALIVAPMGSVVDYAGPFKGYGNILILRHQKGYHSLIAGLDKIDTVVGRSVSAGEPIGQLGSNVDGTPPTLYYELRYKGKPVNPSKKISGL